MASLTIGPIFQNSAVTGNNLEDSSEISIDILEKMERVKRSYFFNNNGDLAEKFREMGPQEITRLIDTLSLRMMEEGKFDELQKTLENLFSIIPDDKFGAAPSAGVISNLVEDAKYYLSVTERDLSFSLRSKLSLLLNKIMTLLDNLILAIGIGEFIKPADEDYEGEWKASKILMLSSLFSVISVFVASLAGDVTAGFVVGGMFLTLSVLSLIWPYIKPMPTMLPASAENWSKLVQEQQSEPQGRKEALDDIANILKQGRHPILVGPSRVGKSLVAKAFAMAIERGDYPELKGKKVFRINTSDLIGQDQKFMATPILKKIADKMGRHNKDIILVLDEIHMACKNKSKIAEQLKTFLDQDGRFPHVIGITTKKEFKHVKKNDAFRQRFDRVNIRSTNKNESLKILSDFLLSCNTKPILSQGSLEYIYEKSSGQRNAVQPNAALKLLQRCVNRTERTQQSETQRKITRVSEEILALRAQSLIQRVGANENYEKISQLKTDLEGLKIELEVELVEITKIHSARKLLGQVTKQAHKTAIKITRLSQEALVTKQANLSLFCQRFLAENLEKFIKAKATDLGIKAEINNELVDGAFSR